jgi:hypothetical protein
VLVSRTVPFRDDLMAVRGGHVLTALLASFFACTLYLPIPTESPALPMPFRSCRPGEITPS